MINVHNDCVSVESSLFHFGHIIQSQDKHTLNHKWERKNNTKRYFESGKENSLLARYLNCNTSHQMCACYGVRSAQSLTQMQTIIYLLGVIRNRYESQRANNNQPLVGWDVWIISEMTKWTNGLQCHIFNQCNQSNAKFHTYQAIYRQGNESE